MDITITTFIYLEVDITLVQYIADNWHQCIVYIQVSILEKTRAAYSLVQVPFRYSLFRHFLLPLNSIRQFFVLVS